MKKFLALVTTITCVLGLTACGSTETISDYQQTKLDYAEQLATANVIPAVMNFNEQEPDAKWFDTYTYDEIAYLLEAQYGIKMGGYIMDKACDSFSSGIEEMGGIVEVGEATATIDDDTIIVKVDITGSIKNAEAEVIVSNDMFMEVESVALNTISTTGELMAKAGLNTLVGMGTVFIMLIIIMFIISAFKFIAPIEKYFADRKAAKARKDAPVVEETAAVSEDTTDYADDTELVAVIAAAIASYEGTSSTDGFVVRSIRKISRR
ncbi:MAG: OadG family protein [Acetatifactor sp.]|nr:OadG family protein [Acetatifactor sp.]